MSVPFGEIVSGTKPNYELIKSPYDEGRKSKIRAHIKPHMLVGEIGGSYSAIFPRDTYGNVITFDFMTTEELRKRYPGQYIDEVDYVLTDCSPHLLIPKELHGTFDAFAVSHVLEHITDPIGLKKSLRILLKSDGIICGALPDHRYSFDFFRPISSRGQFIQAHSEKRKVHPPSVHYDLESTRVTANGNETWNIGDKIDPKLSGSIFQGIERFNKAAISGVYEDTHGWVYTPTSFELNIFEWRNLGITGWKCKIERAPGVEFYFWLTPDDTRDDNVNEKRLEFFKKIILEHQEEIDLITPGRKIEEIGIETFVENSPEKSEEISTEISHEKSPNQIGRRKSLTISVVIPLCNGGRWIIEALRSTSIQTVQPIEIIIVNDGSTDNGQELVEQFIAENPAKNIKLISQENSGQSSARNLGVKHSSGDLIKLLDQDDALYPTNIERLVQPFLEDKKGKLGWTYSNLDEVDEQGKMVTRMFLSTIGTKHPKEDIFTCIREDMFILPSASMISRKAFDQVGGFDERLSGYEDDDLFLRLFQAGYDNIYIDEALSLWRIHPSSGSYSFRMARSRNIYMRKLIDQFPDDKVRTRFYIRDLIVPRFYPAMLEEVRKAIHTGDDDKIEAALDHYRYISQFLQSKRKRKFIDIFAKKQHVKRAFAARALVKPLIVPFIIRPR